MSKEAYICLAHVTYLRPIVGPIPAMVADVHVPAIVTDAARVAEVQIPVIAANVSI
jgi:hypothetical protein